MCRKDKNATKKNMTNRKYCEQKLSLVEYDFLLFDSKCLLKRITFLESVTKSVYHFIDQPSVLPRIGLNLPTRSVFIPFSILCRSRPKRSRGRRKYIFVFHMVSPKCPFSCFNDYFSILEVFMPFVAIWVRSQCHTEFSDPFAIYDCTSLSV